MQSHYDTTYPQFFERILKTRGIDAEKINTYAEMHDSFTLPDMAEAVACIRSAIENGEKILIYGDYDCDGIVSTVMLYEYLEQEGADICYYISERDTEGYGLNLAAVERISQAGINLIITVDNGISAHAEIARAMELGMKVVVTDHHQQDGQIPECVAVVNPHRHDSNYQFKSLCGAGVVLKLIMAMEYDNDDVVMDQFGDLAAIATMGDIVPLLGENRSIVLRGISVLRNTERVGLMALAQVAGLDLATITSEEISFGLVPRINATGRIGSVDLAVELLLCADPQEALELAEKINHMNTRRKDIESGIVADVDDMISANPHLLDSRVLIVKGRNWHHGVLGITASKLVERYRRPCLIFSQTSSGELRGSGRSIEGYNLIEAIFACKEPLLKFGGHPMAAGLSVSEENYNTFYNLIQAYSYEHYSDMPVLKVKLDTTVEISDISIENIKLLSLLEPFGADNPKPLFMLSGVTLAGITPVGDGKHVRLQVTKNNTRLDIIYFRMRAENFPIAIGEVVNCAVALSINTYNNTERVSVNMINIVPASFPMTNKLDGARCHSMLRMGEDLPQGFLSDNAFTREDLSAVFRILRANSPYTMGIDSLLHKLGESFGYFRVLVALDILQELSLLEKTVDEGVVSFKLLPQPQKADINTAKTFKKLTELLNS